MHLISAGGLRGKGIRGHADSVFSEKQGRNHGSTVLYARTVHVVEDASGQAFIRYPGADEIVTGSLQNSAYMCHYA